MASRIRHVVLHDDYPDGEAFGASHIDCGDLLVGRTYWRALAASHVRFGRTVQDIDIARMRALDALPEPQNWGDCSRPCRRNMTALDASRLVEIDLVNNAFAFAYTRAWNILSGFDTVSSALSPRTNMKVSGASCKTGIDLGLEFGFAGVKARKVHAGLHSLGHI